MKRRRKSSIRNLLSLTILFTFLGYQAVYNWLPDYFPAHSLSGQAKAIDGDSLKLNGRSIRLFGIDAPELKQVCVHPQNSTWPCGLKSQQALQKLIDHQVTTCHPIKTDIYRRVLAQCFIHGNANLAETMVRNGWAFAYSRYSQDFVDEEETARRKNHGIWQTDTPEPPWIHRQKQTSIWHRLTEWLGIGD
jgi:endonuclease YncB( thermonuclease family)